MNGQTPRLRMAEAVPDQMARTSRRSTGTGPGWRGAGLWLDSRVVEPAMAMRQARRRRAGAVTDDERVVRGAARAPGSG